MLKQSVSEGTRSVLAVASGGGHWEQLMLLRPALANYDVIYATTVPGLAERSGLDGARLIPDCNRNQPVQVLQCAAAIRSIVARQRPDIVVTTGAAPGLIALALGKLYGARTVWIDSVANSERMSMSGKVAAWFVDLPLTQWQHLSQDRRPAYLGSLL